MKQNVATLDYIFWSLCGSPNEGCCGMSKRDAHELTWGEIQLVTSSADQMEKSLVASAAEKRRFVNKNQHRWMNKEQQKAHAEKVQAEMRARENGS